MRGQGGNIFCPPGYGKINREIRVTFKISFRRLESVPVGHFGPSKEGSKPTLRLISSHSKVSSELRHGVGTRTPFPSGLFLARAQLLHWHWRKKPEATRGWEPLHLAPFCSEDLPTAEDL